MKRRPFYKRPAFLITVLLTSIIGGVGGGFFGILSLPFAACVSLTCMISFLGAKTEVALERRRELKPLKAKKEKQ